MYVYRNKDIGISIDESINFMLNDLASSWMEPKKWGNILMRIKGQYIYQVGKNIYILDF